MSKKTDLGIQIAEIYINARKERPFPADIAEIEDLLYDITTDKLYRHKITNLEEIIEIFESIKSSEVVTDYIFGLVKQRVIYDLPKPKVPGKTYFGMTEEEIINEAKKRGIEIKDLKSTALKIITMK